MKHLFKKLSSGIIGALMISFFLCITGCKGKRPLSNIEEINQKYNERQASAKSAAELFPYIDSLRQEDMITEAEAELFRGHAYREVDKRDDLARESYQKSYDLFCLETNPPSDYFADVSFRSANYDMTDGRLDKGCRILTNALYKLEKRDDFSERWRSSLYMLLASFHVGLGMYDEAKQTYEKAYQSKVKVVHQGLEPSLNLVVLSAVANIAFFAIQDYETAELWCNRIETTLQEYDQDFKAIQMDEVFSELLSVCKLRALIAKGKKAEAVQIYKTTPHEKLVQTYGFSTVMYAFLEEAGLYKEAVNLYNHNDSLYRSVPTGTEMTFATFASFHAPRYRVNRNAGNTEVALALADSVFNNCDSAFMRLNREKAIEMATIYQTHEKEMEVQKAQAETHIHRILLCGTAIILLLICYFLVRSHQHNQELRAKNRSLFEQIEKREQEEQDMLTSLQSQPEEALSSDQQLFRRICALMAEKKPYTEESLNRDELAQMLGSNGKYVSQAIHECSHGETVADFITRYRLEHVARLLRTTDEPVNLIGEMSGIPSRATLARLFRNTYGMTCREYRQAAERTTK